MRRKELEQMYNEMKALKTALAYYADVNSPKDPNVARKALGMPSIEVKVEAPKPKPRHLAD